MELTISGISFGLFAAYVHNQYVYCTDVSYLNMKIYRRSIDPDVCSKYARMLGRPKTNPNKRYPLFFPRLYTGSYIIFIEGRDTLS